MSLRALVVSGMTLFALPAAAEPPGYAQLVALFREWREFQKPRFSNGVPDYTRTAMQEQAKRLPEFQARLAAIDASSWPVQQRVDVELVRAEMNGLDFDLRVRRPWERDPAFYSVIVESESDTPLREGPVMEGSYALWQHPLPLRPDEVSALRAHLKAVPAILDQARGNLVGSARDLWRLGIRTHEEQSTALRRLAEQLAAPHPELVPDAERAREAVDGFRRWLETQLPGKTGTSGVGVENYDWYLRHVHLVPLTWQDELRLMQRELARATAHLELEELRNRSLPPLEPAESPEEWRLRSNGALDFYFRFLARTPVMTVPDYADAALRERISPYLPPERRDFFSQVEMREPLLLICHQVHWIDKARMRRDPHPSPIRRVPLLYNIWDGRAEGFATAMEELMTDVGLLDDRPRARELDYVMIAQRAARGISSLRLHSNEWTIDEAVRFAHENTPRGWLKIDGDLVWGEQQLYLEQPGYGTSYLTGKSLFEELMAERARQLGDPFTLKAFLDEFFACGVIPVSLIRWELTGQRDPRLAPEAAGR